ncbi:MAG: hypothetical protein C5S49_07555 [Candidatus Methanogaster sp.]|nr:MAG: hypothetical protein C5S49_07555 [ANME-2 cluster archaeon]
MATSPDMILPPDTFSHDIIPLFCLSLFGSCGYNFGSVIQTVTCLNLKFKECSHIMNLRKKFGKYNQPQMNADYETKPLA